MKKPKKSKGDGGVSLNLPLHNGKHRVRLSVVTDGADQTIVMSDYNAWRVFGLLAIALHIPLPPEIAEKIDL